ncbi:type II toxin-antitoxin system VapC family toxin [Roseateles sp.]|uniref:type II toxin-antitoxin system VapC family toxin n=1 Tax=Roseateles sp. TaxID=1971397 RepID=UPI00286BD0CA|nr:type II toxin-antitoxin system VapC family toxin [Roseateles sp.]
MRLLLDTHIFLWWVTGDKALSKKARAAIADSGNECFFSVASAWELAIKHSLGKLELSGSLERFLPEQLALNQFQLLPIELSHSLRVASLPWHHRDPFDRLLIAQCQVENLTLVSADKQLAGYGVALIR